ncbi:MAG: HesA/MoeB/ThiF family protein [Polyangiaceae bacterium]
MSRALLVGVGGLGSPAAIVLARAGVGVLGLADDDAVEETNLHRQILFDDADVGRPKLDAAVDGLRRWAGSARLEIVCHRTRVLPHNARDLVRGYDVVVEGSDNFATKFMVADACALEKVPVVHGSAVRWYGTALAVGAAGQPCYRCLFEDIPHEHAPSCAEAGVMGPVVGVVGALQADLALRMLEGADVAGELVTFDGKTGAFRRRRVARRADCPLCGRAAGDGTSPGRIQDVEISRYIAPPLSCDASL